MAQLIGKLVPEDDYTHPLGPEPNFNESMYFNFFDPNRQLGGFVRLGNRANEGRAEMTVCLFLPDGRVLFNFKRAPIENNDRFDAGGLRFEVLEPTERLQTVYQGRASVLEDARSMADPSRAFRESPRCDLLIDLEHHAAGPMYGGAKDREGTQGRGYPRDREAIRQGALRTTHGSPRPNSDRWGTDLLLGLRLKGPLLGPPLLAGPSSL